MQLGLKIAGVVLVGLVAWKLMTVWGLVLACGIAMIVLA